MIVLNTIIGWPAPAKQDTGNAHGAALGADEVADQGLAKFEKSWNQLSHTIAAELHRSHPARQS